jgi:hypothetical protein
MKKIILSLAVVAFIAVGTISVNAQDPQKKEVKKATTEVAKKAAAKDCSTTAKKSCCDATKACDTKAPKTAKAAKKKKN